MVLPRRSNPWPTGSFATALNHLNVMGSPLDGGIPPRWALSLPTGVGSIRITAVRARSGCGGHKKFESAEFWRRTGAPCVRSLVTAACSVPTGPNAVRSCKMIVSVRASHPPSERSAEVLMTRDECRMLASAPTENGASSLKVLDCCCATCWPSPRRSPRHSIISRLSDDVGSCCGWNRQSRPQVLQRT